MKKSATMLQAAALSSAGLTYYSKKEEQKHAALNENSKRHQFPDQEMVEVKRGDKTILMHRWYKKTGELVSRV